MLASAIMWEAAPALRVSPEDRQWLEALIRSGKTPQRVALRARIVLGAAEGRANHALARELGISRPTLYQLLARYGLKKTKSEDQKEKA